MNCPECGAAPVEIDVDDFQCGSYMRLTDTKDVLRQSPVCKLQVKLTAATEQIATLNERVAELVEAQAKPALYQPVADSGRRTLVAQRDTAQRACVAMSDALDEIANPDRQAVTTLEQAMDLLGAARSIARQALPQPGTEPREEECDECACMFVPQSPCQMLCDECAGINDDARKLVVAQMAMTRIMVEWNTSDDRDDIEQPQGICDAMDYLIRALAAIDGEVRWTDELSDAFKDGLKPESAIDGEPGDGG